MDLDALVSTLSRWEIALNLVTLVVLPIELVWLRRSGRLDRSRGAEMVTSAVQFLPLVATSVVTGAAWFAFFRWIEAMVPWEIGLTWWTVALALLGTDFLYYWEHRAGHRVNALWSLYHSVHHSSPVYDQSTAFRLSAVDGTIGTLMFLPLVLVGFPAALVLAMVGIVVGYQTWIHTEIVRHLPGAIEWWLNVPSHHRVHHGTNPRYIDKNYGGILIVWDRLFGTFEPERAPVSYGLTTQIGTTRWLEPQIVELRRTIRRLRRADTWSQRLQIMVRPPGWSTNTTGRPGGAGSSGRPAHDRWVATPTLPR